MKRQALQLLRLALDNSGAEFRNGQWECIEALLKKRRLLVVQRTGWGKSMVYFLATRLLRENGVHLLAYKGICLKRYTINHHCPPQSP